MMDRIIGSCFGGGGGGGHTPVEDANTLQSIATAKMLFAISEGEVQGLVNGLHSVYLNDVPVRGPDNADGSASYNYKGMAEPVFREGTPSQSYVPDFPDQEMQVGGAGGGSAVKITHSGTPLTFNVADTYDSVRVCIGIPALTSTSSEGDMHGTEVKLEFWVSYNGSAYQLYSSKTISGKCTSRYQFTEVLKLRSKGPGPWTVKVVRVTADSVSVNLNNETWLDYHTLIVDSKLNFPNTALLGVKVDAKLFNAVPTVSAEILGLKVRVPNNYTPPTYVPTDYTQDPPVAAHWTYPFVDGDGNPTCYEPGVEFVGLTKMSWTNNPAWVLYDLLTDDRYGLGDYIEEWMVDKWALYQVARYCDEQVPDRYPGVGKEPRFACSCYIQSQADAYQVIQSVASIYRGMTYWAAGSVTTAQDRPTDPTYLFTPSNVVDGTFSYTSTPRRARRNVAYVAWNDPNDGYKQKIEYVADQQAIVDMGFVNEAQISAFGCTSRGQARRLGMWTVYTDYYEREVVTFKSGFEGIVCRPGDVILVHDTDRLQVRLGGRLIDSDGTTHTLDSAPTVSSGKLYVIDQYGMVKAQTILSVVGAVVTTAPFDYAPGAMAQWIIGTATIEPKVFRVLMVKEDKPDQYEIQAIEHNPSKYDYIDWDRDLTDPNDGIGGNGGGGNPNPGSTTKPVNLQLASYSITRDDTIETNVRATWEAPKKSDGSVMAVSGYVVSWRKNLDNWSADVEVSSTSTELANVVPDKYTIRVAARVDNKLSDWNAKSITVAGDARDDYITPAEKPALISKWNKIGGDAYPAVASTSEVLQLMTQAANLGISTTAFDTAYHDLYNYRHDIAGYVFTVNSTPYPLSGWMTSPGVTIYLGRGGWRNWETWLSAYENAREDLKIAISTAIGDAASTPSDTFRSTYRWDFNGAALPTGVSSTLSLAAASTPYAETASKFTTAAGTLIKFIDDPAASAPAGFDITGAQGYVFIARVRRLSGTWRGRCYYSTDGTTFTNYRDVVGPALNVWTDIAWDLRLCASPIGGLSHVKGYALDLTSDAGSVEIDWAATGVYGAGSLQDYNDAVSWAATNALLNSNFQSIMQAAGQMVPVIYASYAAFPAAGTVTNGYLAMDASTGILWRNVSGIWTKVVAGTCGPNSVVAGSVVAGVIGANEIGANKIFVNQLTVANWDNLFPNPNSEYDLTNMASGGIEGVGVSSVFPHAGAKHRLVPSGQTLTPTKDIPVLPGEIFWLSGYCSSYGSNSAGRMEVYYKDKNGTETLVPATGSYSQARWDKPWSGSAGYVMIGGLFQVPSTGNVTTEPVSIRVKLTETSGAGGSAAFDTFYLRRAADANLIVDGAILARHVTAGAIQTYHVSVGPLIQFRSSSLGAYLAGKTDGSQYRGTAAERNSVAENSSDARVYMDGSRLYPSGIPVTYEAEFAASANERGFLINFSTAWSTTGDSGLMIYWSGTNLTVYGVKGLGTGSYCTNNFTTYEQIKTVASVQSADVYPHKLTVIYYDTLTADGFRMKVFIDGVLKLSITDTELNKSGSGSATNFGGQRGGYAGVLLGGSAGSSVSINRIQFGTGYVAIQDGAVTADKLAADLAVLGVVRSPTYNGNSTTVCTVGYKISGTAYTGKLADGTTISTSAEFGSDVIIAGRKALTMNDKLFSNVISRLNNGRDSYWSPDSMGGPYYTTEKMAGWAYGWTECRITPVSTDKVFVMITGYATTPASGKVMTIRLRYGTGTPPAQNSAGTGTLVAYQTFKSATTNDCFPFTLQGVITGLTIGTEIWIDISMEGDDTTGQKFIQSGSSFSIWEL